MPLDTITPSEPSFAEIDGLPAVDLAANLIYAQAAGRGVPGLLAELFSRMRSPGRMTPAEYFYYRLWDPALTRGHGVQPSPQQTNCSELDRESQNSLYSTLFIANLKVGRTESLCAVNDKPENRLERLQ